MRNRPITGHQAAQPPPGPQHLPRFLLQHSTVPLLSPSLPGIPWPPRASHIPNCTLTNPASQPDTGTIPLLRGSHAPLARPASPGTRTCTSFPPSCTPVTAGPASHCSTLECPLPSPEAAPETATTAEAALCQDGSKAEHTCCRCCCWFSVTASPPRAAHQQSNTLIS